MPTATARTTRASIKSRALRALKRLPSSATCDDMMYQLFVRQKIESGLADLNAGRTHSHATLRKEFGLGA